MMLPYPWSVRAKVAVALVNAMPYFVLGDFYDTAMYEGDPMHMGIDTLRSRLSKEVGPVLALCWICLWHAHAMVMAQPGQAAAQQPSHVQRQPVSSTTVPEPMVCKNVVLISVIPARSLGNSSQLSTVQSQTVSASCLVRYRVLFIVLFECFASI